MRTNKLLLLLISFSLVAGILSYYFLVYKNENSVFSKETLSEKSALVTARSSDYVLLARLVSGEARGEPYTGQVGVAAVVINRVKSPKFPNSIPGVIFQPRAFESVSNGQIWAAYPSRTNFNAARDALNGFDPTYGSLFFWNPSKRVSPWIWTRQIIVQIGRHVFGR
ncbi:cell wall hydrolase [Thermovenabulum gondwanense]|uniref:Spore cortex-lytic enzyme n=1 Tax=Thermovenabulum gondwanense TaxID=520767 RepID=A0A162MA32_9FIRM|nr:cell wall hydrolase [Thermovenabulum gondwanense]KYO64761.1 Spore cortex-lytic enzyme [Thermovenabulum gondwanense]